MSAVDLHTFLDQLFNALMGSFVTLLLLSQFGGGDFSREAGFVLLTALPLAAYDIWKRRKRSDQPAPLTIHVFISALAFLAFSGLFVAKYSFGIEAVGYWEFLPLLVFFWANWFAAKEEETPHG